MPFFPKPRRRPAPADTDISTTDAAPRPFRPRPATGTQPADRPRFQREERNEFSSRDDRPRREDGGFGRSDRGGDRPRFNDGERGPRREGGFGGDRPRFNDRNDRGPRPEGGDRPRFNKERGPRDERKQGDRPRFNKGGDRPNAVREERPDYANSVGEVRRSFSGIRTYRAPAELKGKAAPVKVIRPEDKLDGDKK